MRGARAIAALLAGGLLLLTGCNDSSSSATVSGFVAPEGPPGRVVVRSFPDGVEVLLEGASVPAAVREVAARTGLAVRVEEGSAGGALTLVLRAESGVEALRALTEMAELELDRETHGEKVVYRVGPPRAIFATDPWHLLGAGVILLIAFLADRAIDIFLRRREKASRIGAVRFKQVAPLVRVAMWVLAAGSGLLVVLSVPPHTAFALTGVGLLAVGFASKEFTSNILAGLAIAIDRPLHLGDFVTVGDHSGEVVRIGLRSTQLVTLDDTMVTIPNVAIATGTVASANYGAIDALIPVLFYVSHQADLARVRAIVWEGVVTSAYCSWRRPVHVTLTEETWATKVEAHAYVFDVRHQLLFVTDVTHRVKLAFEDEGIRYPTLGAVAGVVAESTEQQSDADEGNVESGPLPITPGP